eukprot:2421714-Amphidinium_carterae.1
MFAGFANHKKRGDVCTLECANAFLSCRAVGQTVPIHLPQTRPTAANPVYALVTPETYNRSNNIGRAMTVEAIAHRNNFQR